MTASETIYVKYKTVNQQDENCLVKTWACAGKKLRYGFLWNKMYFILKVCFRNVNITNLTLKVLSLTYVSIGANSVDPDQTDPIGSV